MTFPSSRQLRKPGQLSLPNQLGGLSARAGRAERDASRVPLGALVPRVEPI